MVYISKNVTVCSSFFKKGTGLMFHRFRPDFAYVFPFKKQGRYTVTMWFVFFPIDIVFLDAQGFVVDCRASLRPFQTYRSKQQATTFIEFPPGTLARFGIAVGSHIQWSSQKVTVK